MDAHLDRTTLEKLATGRRGRRDLRQDLFHLSVCRYCRWRFEAQWPEAAAQLLGMLYLVDEPADEAAARAKRERLYREAAPGLEAQERLAEQAEISPALEARLTAASAAQRDLLLSHVAPGPGAAASLLKRAEGLWHSDPKGAHRLADGAVELVRQAAGSEAATEYEARLLEDLRARALAYRGNASRVLGELAQAERDLLAARIAQVRGTCHLDLFARVVELESSLRRDQRRLTEAADLASAAIGVYQDLGDNRGEARATIKRSIALGLDQQHEEAIHLLQGLLDRYGPSRLEAGLSFSALECLATELVEAGRPFRARQLMPEVQRLAASAGRLQRLRVRWLEGTIAAGCGLDHEAERVLDDARQAFIDEEMGYDAAMVTLHLATLYLRQGRTAEVRELAEQMWPIFEGLGIHREALAALRLFWEAARAEQVTASWLHDLTRYLQLARNDPGYRFDSPP